MFDSDSNLIFESYFHAINNAINEARGRKKQFSERVKQLITDPKTGEQRYESYYEMMQRLKRQAIAAATEKEEQSTEDQPEDQPEISVDEPKSSIESELQQKINQLKQQLGGETSTEELPELEPEEDVDIDLETKPIEDVGSFNFNSTLTLGDKYENAPGDAMTQDILSYVSDTPATGDEIVNFLIDKGVDPADAKNKVASLALLDILKLYFSGEESPKELSEIDVPNEYEKGGEESDLEAELKSFLPSKTLRTSTGEETDDIEEDLPYKALAPSKEINSEEPDEDLSSTLQSFLPPKKIKLSGMSEEERRKQFVDKIMQLRRQRQEELQRQTEEERRIEEPIDVETEISEEDEPVD